MLIYKIINKEHDHHGSQSQPAGREKWRRGGEVGRRAELVTKKSESKFIKGCKYMC